MSTSLIEFVMALILSGVVFASAVIPTSSLLARQETLQQEARARARHQDASAQVQRVLTRIWRPEDAPTGYEPLTAATSQQVQVGTWTCSFAADGLQLTRNDGTPATLVGPLSEASFSYRLTDGDWAGSVSSDQFDQIVAIRYAWTDPDTSWAYGNLAVPTDRMFGDLTLKLPETDGKGGKGNGKGDGKGNGNGKGNDNGKGNGNGKGNDND